MPALMEMWKIKHNSQGSFVRRMNHTRNAGNAKALVVGTDCPARLLRDASSPATVPRQRAAGRGPAKVRRGAARQRDASNTGGTDYQSVLLWCGDCPPRLIVHRARSSMPLDGTRRGMQATRDDKWREPSRKLIHQPRQGRPDVHQESAAVKSSSQLPGRWQRGASPECGQTLAGSPPDWRDASAERALLRGVCQATERNGRIVSLNRGGTDWQSVLLCCGDCPPRFIVHRARSFMPLDGTRRGMQAARDDKWREPSRKLFRQVKHAA